MGTSSLPFLFLTFLHLITSINGSNSTNSQNPLLCPSFDCANGIKINYPFWHQIDPQFHQYCGYPGFNLSCIDHKIPILHLTNNKNNPNYTIKHINYSNKTLTLSHNFPQNSTCPKLLPLDSQLNYYSSLLYNSGNTMVRFFYNCSLYPPSVMHIKCLMFGSKRSFVFKERAVPEFDWGSFCESTVVVPVVDEAVVGDNLVEDFGRALRDGFKLSWMNRDRVCQSCEDSGGFCGGYSNGGNICICSDGRHLIDCLDDTTNKKGVKGPKDMAAILIGGELNYAVIGVMFFAGLIIMVIVFFFVQKKKIVWSYKPV